MAQTIILAVDDEAFNRDLIELAFADEPQATVHSVENGRQAIDFLEQSPDVHVILLDLSMPVMDGFATLEVLTHHEVLNRIPVIVVTANMEEKKKALRFGATDFLYKPVDIEELKLRTMNHARTKDYQDQLGMVNEILDEKVRERTRELQQALEMAVSAEREIAFRLGRAAEFRDLETGSHIKRMSHFSMKLAELTGLGESQVVEILHASPLHDIGKVGIPDNILLKSGRLTEQEFSIMKKHTEIGGKILAQSDEYPVIRSGRIIAEQHHERYDGTGYPCGLKGEQIHIFGRICAIADVFDALSSRRVYKKPFSLEKSMAIMEEGKGTHFDPELLDLFIDNIKEFQKIMARFGDSEEELPSILELIEGRS